MRSEKKAFATKWAYEKEPKVTNERRPDEGKNYNLTYVCNANSFIFGCGNEWVDMRMY